MENVSSFRDGQGAAFLIVPTAVLVFLSNIVTYTTYSRVHKNATILNTLPLTKQGLDPEENGPTRTYFPRTKSGIDFKPGGKFKFDHCLEINLAHEGTLQDNFLPRVPKISLAFWAP